jgi:hypothetical protein
MKNKILDYDWIAIEVLVGELAKKVKKKKYKYVYGVPRGGKLIALMLSHQLGLKYLENIEDAPSESGFSKNILVVDDVVDSGNTIAQYYNFDTAVLDYKPQSKYRPTYYMQEVANDVWVKYPWETKKSSKVDYLDVRIKK